MTRAEKRREKREKDRDAVRMMASLRIPRALRRQIARDYKENNYEIQTEEIE